MVICKNCEEPFKPVRKGRQFCSRECAAHFRIRNVTPKAEAFKASYTDDPGEAARPFRPVRLPRPGEVVIRSSAGWV